MARGGKREGAGRKRHVPPLKPHYVALTEDQAKLLRMWGRGDLSAGLRWLVEVAELLVRRAETNPPRTGTRG
jgi:hypothetical protein